MDVISSPKGSKKPLLLHFFKSGCNLILSVTSTFPIKTLTGKYLNPAEICSKMRVNPAYFGELKVLCIVNKNAYAFSQEF